MTSSTSATGEAPGEPAHGNQVPAADGRLRPGFTRLPSLTGLRVPAAILVFLSHVGLPFPNLRLLKDDELALDFYDVTKNGGQLALTFFFVLSGFILTWSARRQDTVTAFWRRRFVKIYPNYVIAWAAAMLLFASAFTPTRTAVANLLMVHVWIPEFDVYGSVNQPSWSLACELFFYASFPFLHMLFLRIKPEHLKYWISGLIAVIMATPAFTYAVLSDTPAMPGSGGLDAKASIVQYWFSYAFPPVRILDFALGMLLAHAVLRGRWWNIGLIWSGALLAGSYVLAFYVPFLYQQRSTTIIPIAFLVAAAATADAENRFTLFRGRTMVRLGELTFAFYLIHFVVLVYVRKKLGTGLYSTPQSIGLMVMEFAISGLIAWAMYTLVERPITRRWSTSRRARRSPADASATAEPAATPVQ